MSQPVRIVGSYLSPYVRKVLVALHEKGIDYRIDPIVPFFGDDRFAAASPIRRVPVYIDERVTLCDSSVICQYLEEAFPSQALYPDDVAARAHARWLEEFADTRMGDVFIWRLFNQVAIGPAVWGRPTDKDVVRKAVDEDIPSVLDYLETQAPDGGFLFGGQLSIADISIAVFFRNAAFCRYAVDASRWPKTAGLIDRILATGGFRALAPFEQLCIKTPIASQRAALGEIHAPLTDESWGTEKPRAGIMPI
ncbi:MAG TPA: glutathione S-transferase family protein [Candidatus Limnocylindrales bacterium]|nr:glutathione S-transferase family protein [Candidatus Limnocylindrales bacterium]